MTADNVSASHRNVRDLLAKRSMHEAFAVLNAALSRQTDPRLSDLLKKQEDTYRYMIHYLVEGYADESRQNMLAEIVACLHFINDSLRRNAILTDSPDLYSSTLRFERMRKASLQSRLSDYRSAVSLAALAIEADPDSALGPVTAADEALSALFSYIWTMFGSSGEDYQTLTEAMKDADLPFEFRAQVISALFLGNLDYFDRKGVECLMDIYEGTSDPRISARALVAIILLIALNPARASIEPRLKTRFALWQDSLIIYTRLREVVMSIIRAHDTQRISSKMKDEVIPELMKLKPELIKRLGKISSASDMEMLEANPEWEEIINKNGLGEKLKELTEMQLEGGDVMMLAFSNLKNFPFFNSVANWFLPFTLNHHEFGNDAAGTKEFFSELLDMDGVMCDSDKYSFVISLGKMPETQRKSVMDQMGMQMAQLKEAMADRKLKSSVPEFDMEVTRYVRDLYRFFKLFRKKEEFRDPFLSPIDFGTVPFLNTLLDNTEILSLIGEFYFKRGYYTEALPLLLKLSAEAPEDVLLLEKTGYAYHSLGNIQEALKWYKKAELFQPDSKWLIKKIALCNRLQNNFKEAAEYYTKALDSDPDNYHLLMSAGNCMLESGDIAGALAHYYHANYARPDRTATWRAVAWGELMNNNIAKSLEYYTKLLLDPDVTASDHLNAGHCYLLSHDYKNAVECYKNCARHPESSVAKMEEAVREDLPIIEKAGANVDELLLLLDKVKYDLR